MKVMFVCSGNSCRSPMAELYFNFCNQTHQAHAWQAISAGCSTLNGMTISAPAEAVMHQLGIDCAAFRSHQITREMAAECDLIIAMTRGHLTALQRFLPGMTEQIHLLGEYADMGDIPDPFGGSVEDYQEIFAVMRPALDNLWATLNRTRR